MSQQPPYGPPDPQQPEPGYPQTGYPQPYTPYSQGSYPNPYQQFPQPRNNSTRNVLIAVGVVIVLFCAGIFAVGAWFFNNIDDAFDGNDYPGSEDDPVSVEEGEAFSIRGFDYDAGWTATTTDGEVVVSGVRGTNDRDDEDTESANLVFNFYRANDVLASVRCSYASSIPFGRSATMSCTDYGSDITGFDEVEVFDTSYSE